MLGRMELCTWRTGPNVLTEPFRILCITWHGACPSNGLLSLQLEKGPGPPHSRVLFHFGTVSAPGVSRGKPSASGRPAVHSGPNDAAVNISSELGWENRTIPGHPRWGLGNGAGCGMTPWASSPTFHRPRRAFTPLLQGGKKAVRENKWLDDKRQQCAKEKAEYVRLHMSPFAARDSETGALSRAYA